MSTRSLISFGIVLFLLIIGCEKADQTTYPQSTDEMFDYSGEWSEVVNGMKARLLICEGDLFAGTRIIQVYIELRNVSDVLNPLYISSQRRIRFQLLDDNEYGVSQSGHVANILSPPPFDLVLPHDSSLRYRVSVTGFGVPPNERALIGVGTPYKCWIIQKNDHGEYFISGNFMVPKEEDRTKRWWSGEIKLPKVKVL